MSKKTILLIDDDDLFLMLTCRLFKDEPYLERIDTANTAEDALAHFQKLREQNNAYPDAIFIDLDMPQMDGLELAQLLKDSFLSEKNAYGSIPKLFILSSSISQRDRHTASSLHFISDYMEKPLSKEMLLRALEMEQQPPKQRKAIAGTDIEQVNRRNNAGEKNKANGKQH